MEAQGIARGNIKFVVIPESVLKNQELTPAARLVFGILQFHRGRKDSCTVEIETMASEIGLAGKTVSRAVKQLEEIGLVRVVRAYKTVSTYEVKRVYDDKFLCVDLNLKGPASVKVIYSYIRFKIGSNGVAWPKQETIATDTGYSLKTVERALEFLESNQMLKIQHVRGGLKQKNRYSLGFGLAGHFDGPGIESRPSKCPAIDNTFKEVKRNTAFFAFKGGLSKRKPDQKAAYLALMGALVAPTVAKSIVYDQKHTPESVFNAIDNARNAGKAARYIVGALNLARSEGHTVKPSRLSRLKRDLASRIRQDMDQPRLTESECKAKKDEMLRLLGVA